MVERAGKRKWRLRTKLLTDKDFQLSLLGWLIFMVLISLMNLSMVALEVPTGVVADRFSRKWSNGLGKLVLAMPPRRRMQLPLTRNSERV